MPHLPLPNHLGFDVAHPARLANMRCKCSSQYCHASLARDTGAQQENTSAPSPMGHAHCPDSRSRHGRGTTVSDSGLGTGVGAQTSFGRPAPDTAFGRGIVTEVGAFFGFLGLWRHRPSRWRLAITVLRVTPIRSALCRPLKPAAKWSLSNLTRSSVQKPTFAAVLVITAPLSPTTACGPIRD